MTIERLAIGQTHCMHESWGVRKDIVHESKGFNMIAEQISLVGADGCTFQDLVHQNFTRDEHWIDFGRSLLGYCPTNAYKVRYPIPGWVNMQSSTCPRELLLSLFRQEDADPYHLLGSGRFECITMIKSLSLPYETPVSELHGQEFRARGLISNLFKALCGVGSRWDGYQVVVLSSLGVEWSDQQALHLDPDILMLEKTALIEAAGFQFLLAHGKRGSNLSDFSIERPRPQFQNTGLELYASQVCSAGHSKTPVLHHQHEQFNIDGEKEGLSKNLWLSLIMPYIPQHD